MSNTYLYLLMFAYSLFTPWQQAYATIKKDESVIYYNVTGITPSEIRHSINKHRLRDYDAFTDWNIKWQYDYAPSSKGNCQITNHIITLTIKQRLPKWIDYSLADSEVQRKWKKYYDALILHEDGHALLSRQAANKIDGFLYNFEAACSSINDEADYRVLSILEELKSKNHRYELETNHGETQGARFP